MYLREKKWMCTLKWMRKMYLGLDAKSWMYAKIRRANTLRDKIWVYIKNGCADVQCFNWNEMDEPWNKWANAPYIIFSENPSSRADVACEVKHRILWYERRLNCHERRPDPSIQ